VFALLFVAPLFHLVWNRFPYPAGALTLQNYIRSWVTPF